jgi:hypothetical protein
MIIGFPAMAASIDAPDPDVELAFDLVAPRRLRLLVGLLQF